MNLTDSEKLKKLSYWLLNEYRHGSKISEDAVVEVAGDLIGIAAKIKESPAIPQQPHHAICDEATPLVTYYCNRDNEKCTGQCGKNFNETA